MINYSWEHLRRDAAQHQKDPHNSHHHSDQTTSSKNRSGPTWGEFEIESPSDEQNDIW
jgi:hypothetical protein